MKITDKCNTIEFGIIGYQFPNAGRSKPNDPDYDANWLTVQVGYTEDETTAVFQDSCVLTWELKEMADALSEMLDDRETAYISEFMEPYLKFAVARAGDNFTFTIDFVCDVSDGEWKKIKATQLLDREQLSAVLDEVKQYLITYPAR